MFNIKATWDDLATLDADELRKVIESNMAVIQELPDDYVAPSDAVRAANLLADYLEKQSVEVKPANQWAKKALVFLMQAIAGYFINEALQQLDLEKIAALLINLVKSLGS